MFGPTIQRGGQKIPGMYDGRDVDDGVSRSWYHSGLEAGMLKAGWQEGEVHDGLRLKTSGTRSSKIGLSLWTWKRTGNSKRMLQVSILGHKEALLRGILNFRKHKQDVTILGGILCVFQRRRAYFISSLSSWSSLLELVTLPLRKLQKKKKTNKQTNKNTRIPHCPDACSIIQVDQSSKVQSGPLDRFFFVEKNL